MTKAPLFTNPRINTLLLIDITFIVYIAVFISDFSSLDDYGLMESLQQGWLTVPSLVASGGVYLRPLTVLTYLLDYQLWGANAAAFHFTNLIIHIANACLVYHLCRSYLPEKSNREGTSFLAALFFAVSPLNSEPVLWVSGRTDLLCCFFFLAALIILINDRLSLMSAAGGMFTAYFSSLLAKESSIVLFAILPLYLLFVRTGKTRQVKMGLWFSVTLACSLYLFMRLGPLGQLDSGTTKIVSNALNQSSSDLIYKSVASVGFYIKKLLWPYPLNLAIQNINEPVYFIASAAAIIVMSICFLRYHSSRLPLLIITFCLIPPLLAFHGNIPWTLYAERYLYLPMVGMTLLIGLLLANTPRLPQSLPFFLIIPFAVTTVHRSWQWADPVALWQDTVRKSPNFPPVSVTYAHELIKVGRIDDADTYINKARSLGFDNDLLRKCASSINHVKNTKGIYPK